MSGMRLPQTLANLEIVLDMLGRLNKGVEQSLVMLPQGAPVAEAVSAQPEPGRAGLRVDDQPAAAVPDRLPAGQRVAGPGGHQSNRRRCPKGLYLQDPRRTPWPTWSAARATCPAPTSREQAGRDAGRMPQQRALHPARHQPVVRRPQPDPSARPRPPGVTSREPGYRDTGAVDQQRMNVAGEHAAAAGPVTSDPLSAGDWVRFSATVSNPTCARTLGAAGAAVYPVQWGAGRAGRYEIPSRAIRAVQETTDGRRCWLRPAEPPAPPTADAAHKALRTRP